MYCILVQCPDAVHMVRIGLDFIALWLKWSALWLSMVRFVAETPQSLLNFWKPAINVIVKNEAIKFRLLEAAIKTYTSALPKDC